MPDRPDTKPGGTLSGVVLILLTLLSWASVPLFLRYFADYIDGWTANGWRYGISALFWLPVLLVGRFRRSLPKGLWAAAIVPSLFNCVGQSMFAWAPYFIEPGLMTFLLRFQIVFVTLGAYVFFPSERALLRTGTFWIGLSVVFVGAAGVLLAGREPPRGATAFGVFLGLFSGVLFAGYALSVRYFMSKIHPILAFSAISLYTATVLVALMVFLGKRSGLGITLLTSGQLQLLVLSAFVGIAFAHAMYYAGIIRLGVAVSSGIILLQPILTSLASYFLFGEQLTVAQWVFGLGSLFGAGILLSSKSAKDRAAAGAVDRKAIESQDSSALGSAVCAGEKL